ncbi:hypothetical protein TNCV_3859651 [Trichonephila clavipes]|nr:hypothetical protein TNCV_3859651 [Trichonephila clavipes]
MAYLAKGNKPDLLSVCEEMGVEVEISPFPKTLSVYILTHDCLSNRKNNKQMVLNMVYAFPSLQCLLRTISSEPAGAPFLVVGVPIPQSEPVRVFGCSPDEASVLQ